MTESRQVTSSDRAIGHGSALSLAARTYFSGLHMQSAAKFVRAARETESQGNPHFDSDVIQVQVTQVTGAVLTTVAFLEATINEIFVDADEEANGGCVSAMLEADRRHLARFWRLEIPRTAAYPIVRKYEVALAILRREELDRGSTIYENAQAVIRLRNALVHFEPSWYEHVVGENRTDDSMDKLERTLRGKFPLSPLVGDISAFFPARSLGYGCARWALRSAVELTDRFFNRLGMEPTYEHLRGTLPDLADAKT
jgi:hypothetical protein